MGRCSCILSCQKSKELGINIEKLHIFWFDYGIFGMGFPICHNFLGKDSGIGQCAAACRSEVVIIDCYK